MQAKPKKSRSKEKKTKKEKDKSEKRNKKKASQEGIQEEEISSRNREEYEETNGTVSQEPERTEPLPFVRLLAEDSVLRMVSRSKVMEELSCL